MAWQSSNSLEYQTTCGQSCACTSQSAAWKCVCKPDPDRESYENIDPAADVPLLAFTARDWQCIASYIPGFTLQMLSVADLPYATDHSLASHLNSVTKGLGLQKFKHVSDTMDQLSSRFISIAEREALELSLDQFFVDIADDSAQQCREQWSTCVDWTDTPTSVLRPLVLVSSALMPATLQQLHSDVQHQLVYAAVGEAAMAMMKHLAKVWNIDL